MRIVIELKTPCRGRCRAQPALALHLAAIELPGQYGFALNGGRPETLNLKDFLRAFVDFREEVVTRRTKFLLGKARDAAHLQVGLAIAVANIDEVIRVIRTSPDAATAREALMSRDWPARDMAPLIALIADPRHVLSPAGMCRLSEAQARGILELRLQRLTALPVAHEIGQALEKACCRDRSIILDIAAVTCAALRHPSRMSCRRLNSRMQRRAVRSSSIATPTSRTRISSSVEDVRRCRLSHAGYTSQRVPAPRPIARSVAAAKAAPACRRATRISSPNCSSLRRTRRCCSSRRLGRPIKKKSGASPRPPRRRVARHWSNPAA